MTTVFLFVYTYIFVKHTVIVVTLVDRTADGGCKFKHKAPTKLLQQSMSGNQKWMTRLYMKKKRQTATQEIKDELD